MGRYGYDGSDYYARARFEDRFNVEKEPNEPNRFDWEVEIDAFEPASMPVKRTVLGRMAHEAATVVLNEDGRVMIHIGDDDYPEHVCRLAGRRIRAC